MFRSLRKFCRLQKSLRNLKLHTSISTPQTWNHFQFLKAKRNSPLKTSEKLQKVSEAVTITPGKPKSPPPGLSLLPNAPGSQQSKIPRSRVFYSTCSDKPPKPPKKSDCTPKPKKSSCSEKSYEKLCPDLKDPASCSTNKPKCPEKCPKPPSNTSACSKPKPKPKPCAQPVEKSKCSKPPLKSCPQPPKPCPKPEEKSKCSKPPPKPCPQPEPKSKCSKPPAKPSGCGGGKKPPPCSRSYSSCAAEPDKTPDLTFGEQQRRKIAEFCAKRKGNSKKGIEIKDEEHCEQSESFSDRIKREKEETAECLKNKTEFSELGYTRIHCKESVRDIISRDAKKFLREVDPYGEILHQKVGKVSSDQPEKARNRKNNWLESILIQ
ncbi:gibberellin-regulated protein 14 [Fopius arisanus]|uniref:Gibberellin-regulated protein 14 n=1 Tax=Fopius arisanus TaxID=64838 RepID=A0A0C9RDS0_9HYME|nr:PREDICTED: gibberellin-regulated protein 14-like [Fopius arisanus]